MAYRLDGSLFVQLSQSGPAMGLEEAMHPALEGRLRPWPRPRRTFARRDFSTGERRSARFQRTGFGTSTSSSTAMNVRSVGARGAGCSPTERGSRYPTCWTKLKARSPHRSICATVRHWRRYAARSLAGVRSSTCPLAARLRGWVGKRMSLDGSSAPRMPPMMR
jgi:hypothetical protein